MPPGSSEAPGPNELMGLQGESSPLGALLFRWSTWSTPFSLFRFLSSRMSTLLRVFMDARAHLVFIEGNKDSVMRASESAPQLTFREYTCGTVAGEAFSPGGLNKCVHWGGLGPATLASGDWCCMAGEMPELAPPCSVMCRRPTGAVTRLKTLNMSSSYTLDTICLSELPEIVRD